MFEICFSLSSKLKRCKVIQAKSLNPCSEHLKLILTQCRRNSRRSDEIKAWNLINMAYDFFEIKRAKDLCNSEQDARMDTKNQQKSIELCGFLQRAFLVC